MPFSDHRQGLRIPGWLVALSAIASLAIPVLASLTALPVEITRWAACEISLLLLAGTATLLLLAATALSRNRILGGLATLLVGMAIAWHWRERVWPPESRTLSISAGLLATIICFPVIGALARRISAKGLAAMALLGLLGTSACAAALYTRSPYCRWILLRHVRSVGTALYLAIGNSPSEVLARLQSQAGGSDESHLETSANTLHAASSKSPNVLVILVDTLRADALGPWGGPTSDIPTLDRLAHDSIVFRDVHSNSSWTKPSVASFFTGLLPEEHGARDRHEALSTRFVTLAERFEEIGYRTAAFVSNYANVGRNAGFDQGFQHFEEVQGQPYARAPVINRAVESWLMHQDGSRPYFAYVHYLEPHDPYLSGDLPADLRPRSKLPAYRAEIRFFDSALDGLLRSVSISSPRETAILLVSDHGEEFGEHGGDYHGRTLYSEQLRVPALLYWSAVSPHLIDAPLELRDFYDLLPSLSLPGFDVDTWAQHHARTQRYASVLQTTSSYVSFRPYLRFVAAKRIDIGHQVAIWSGYGDTLELYDDSLDPGERDNLADANLAWSSEAKAALWKTVARWEPTTLALSGERELEQLRALGYLK